MSFFDFLFGTIKKKKISFEDKSRLSRQNVIDLVRSIKSLDYKQREVVEDVLIKELDDGGVTKWEYREAIRKMSLKRRELGLSEVDIRNLRRII